MPTLPILALWLLGIVQAQIPDALLACAASSDDKTIQVQTAAGTRQMWLGKCIRPEDVTTILAAIANGSMRDLVEEMPTRVPAQESSSIRVHLTPLDLFKVYRLDIARPDELQRDFPPHQFTVSTSYAPPGSSGTRIYMRIRDGQVEIVGFAVWIE